jgi:ATP-binding cassette subfamily B protein
LFRGNADLRRLMSGDQLKAASVSQTLKKFGGYFRPFWPVLVLVALLVIASTWTQVTAPDVIGQVVDCYLAPGTPPAFAGQEPAPAGTALSESNCWFRESRQPSGFTQSIMRTLLTLGGFEAPPDNPADLTAAARLAGLARMILIVIGLYAGSAVLTGMTFFGMSWAGQHVLRDIRVELFRHLQRLSMSYYAENEAGDLMSRITNDSETIQQAISFALINVLSGILLIVWIAYSMLARSLAFGILSLLIAPIMLLVTNWFSSQARKAFRRTREEMGSINAELQEGISAVREVQAFNRADENIENFRLTNAANRDANIRAVAYTSALAPVLEGLGYIALAVVVGVGGLILLNGGDLWGTTVSLGLIITFLAYVQRFNQPIAQISILWTNLQNAIAGAERIFGLLAEEPGITDLPGATAMPPIRGRVAFHEVNFDYKQGEPVLRGIDLTAEPGQTVAIVGPTGAGKTTIINLIPRFYDARSGLVSIDGHDVSQVELKSLRNQIGIVLQDTFLFSTSVMENIRFGRPGASDEEVIAAARLAHADSFIERLPQGYQTVLGERGSGLSQGQRQLLAIARAALADPRILILDEATSSVDTRTERLIQQALEELLVGRTSFVIAHRLSTIRNADLLLVLDQGRIVERGRHDELLARRGYYHQLYMSQFWRGDEMEMSANGSPANLGLPE